MLGKPSRVNAPAALCESTGRQTSYTFCGPNNQRHTPVVAFAKVCFQQLLQIRPFGDSILAKITERLEHARVFLLAQRIGEGDKKVVEGWMYTMRLARTGHN